MENVLFTISGFDVTILQVLLCIAAIAAGIFIFAKLSKYAFSNETGNKIPAYSNSGFITRLGMSVSFLVVLVILRLLNFDIILFNINEFDVTINHIAEIMSLFSLALLFDWIISHLVIRNKYRKREIPARKTFEQNKHNETKATKLVRYIVYIYIGQVMLKRLNLDVVLIQREIKGDVFTIFVSDIMIAVMIILIARVLVWFVTQVTLYRMYQSNQMDEGIQYAINQLVMYVVYVIAFLFALDRLVSDMSIVYGGAAALLVGIGLGLQQTFNDFFSGLVLLFERSVMVGDILEIDGQVGRVLKIGLRASRIETRNSVSMLVPNSKLVNQSVINWTHYDNIVRFDVGIAVAYGTDTSLVSELLLKAANTVDDVLKTPEPFVRLNDFGDNGLVFSLYFFSNQVMVAENIKSAVRFEIEKLFRINQINIPFPQRELWMKQGSIS
ncbi:MAG: mechanosensitive ion channel domain-containing protein [Saprospiraceae bacterium]